MILPVLLVAAEGSEEAREATICLVCTVLSAVMLAACTSHQSSGYLQQKFCVVIVARRCLFQIRLLSESSTMLF